MGRLFDILELRVKSAASDSKVCGRDFVFTNTESHSYLSDLISGSCAAAMTLVE